MKSRIVATGSYLPEKILTNADLSRFVDTSDEWIIERTGIRKRHIVAEGELTSDIAFKASEALFKTSSVRPEEVEMVIVATTTPDLTFPSTAAILQSKLGIKAGFAFDIQAVCSGFVFALSCADNFIKSGQVKNALVVGADSLSRIVNWTDRNTCVLFGDGAGAVLLQASNENGILASDLHSDGNLSEILRTTGGVSLSQNSGFIEMSGKEVFKHAVEKMSKSVLSVLAKAGLSVSDIDLLVPHQANLRILDAVASRLNLTQEKVIITVQDHANTSAASIPLALDFANRNKKIKEGDVVVLEALGAGLTWGSVVLKW